MFKSVEVLPTSKINTLFKRLLLAILVVELLCSFSVAVHDFSKSVYTVILKSEQLFFFLLYFEAKTTVSLRGPLKKKN